MSAYPEVDQAIKMLRNWVSMAETMQAGFAIEPDDLEKLRAKSKDYIENV